MRIRNQYADPNCEQMIPTWNSTTVHAVVTQDGRHWNTTSSNMGALFRRKCQTVC